MTDGLLDEVILDMDGRNPSGVLVDVTFTIDSEYGQAQGLEAPDSSLLVEPSTPDFSDALGEDFQADFEAAMEVLGEVEERRPGLGEDASDGIATDTEAAGAALQACLVAAGEPAAAEAMATLFETSQPAD